MASCKSKYAAFEATCSHLLVFEGTFLRSFGFKPHSWNPHVNELPEIVMLSSSSPLVDKKQRPYFQCSIFEVASN